ncbi:hypothetical protein OSH11_11900 [Kaistia dalseonensis]|uniref:DUF2280 domain-containing protein n=1 Tax=Kaistia dalseonensis TaxID=410840 RepID=A0ABU0H6S2_9HYPH|nr:hypothetical protein [Kaistia dalseonensis]MCX5495412.1 hypothetical protein [Kaistia dalseonensis]MDQ0438002.1 hypothetical protein [Kaistia dalseonensis]
MTKPLFDVFRATMMEIAAGSRKEAQDAFVAKMKADPAYLDLLAVDYFERMAAVHTVHTEVPDSVAFGRTGVSQDKVERLSRPRGEPVAIALVRRNREETAARTAAVIAEVRANIRSVILLDLVLPNGKALRDCTGAECIKAGGFFEAVGKSIKGSQVVDKHLTEADLQNIKARFFQANISDRGSKRSDDKRKRA